MASDYQFVSTDTDALVALMISAYESMTGVTVRPASPERLFIMWVADVIIQTRAQINYAANQNIPSRAAGANLDALGGLFYEQERPAAAPAVSTMRFHISAARTSAVLIPFATRVTDASRTLTWQTIEDAYIPIGETYADVGIQCATVGAVGNGYTPGQINTLVDLFAFYSRCENITGSAGGHDEATDSEYYERMRASMDAYSTAGAEGGYIYWAKQVSTEIADVVANRPADGRVSIYVLMSDGAIAGDEIKDAVYEACSPKTVRPLTDYVAVEDPDIVDYDIALTYYIPSDSTMSASDVEAAVSAAVDDYVTWQNGKLGRDINPSRLISLLMDTGIKRAEVTAPAFAVLKDGSDGTAPQIARVVSKVITNGGYEDE